MAHGRHPRNALTASGIRAATQPGIYADGLGLYLRVERSGTKRWIQRLVIQGKRRNLGLGGWPAVSLKDAREMAIDNRSVARAGRNPLDERKQHVNTPTFAEASTQVIAFHRPTWSNGKHAAQWTSTLETYAYPMLGSRLVNEITSGEVLRVLTSIWTSKPETARRVRQRIRAVLNWCIAQGYRSDNPSGEAISAALPRIPKVAAHHMALPYTAVAGTLQAVHESTASMVVKLSLEFLVLTAARSGEVRHAQWGEIDTEARTWTIPAVRMKAKREHRVPLSSRALDVLDEVWALDNGSGLIFPAPRSGGPLSNMAHLQMLRLIGVDAVPHGFRSSFRDWASENTHAPHAVMEAALAHAIPSATEAAYARSDLFERRRMLMDQWAGVPDQ